jgi:hypothetical protein
MYLQIKFALQENKPYISSDLNSLSYHSYLAHHLPRFDCPSTVKAYPRPVWCFTPVIPALGRLSQEDHGFKASLGYITRSVSKNQPPKKQSISSLTPQFSTRNWFFRF